MNHGGKRALILVDFINLFDFPHAEKLAARAVEAAKATARLKERMKAEGVPCIYANDNFGHWRSEFSKLVAECLAKEGPSAAIAKLLEPTHDDYSVLKPRHSAFYETPLHFLLDELGIDSLVVTGLSTDMCVSATAQDAYVRKYKLWVPCDCVAADTAEHEREALDLMSRTLKADIRPSTA
jgi:nicotinamidase-related amidase